MWSILFGLGGSIIQWIMTMYALLTLKEWVTIGVCFVVIIMGLKVLSSMFDFFKTLLSTSFMRWVCGGLLIFGLGAGTGYCTRSSGSSSGLGPDSVKEYPIQKRDSMMRGMGYIINGKIYYPGSFINKHLEKKGVNERFKEKP